MVLFFFAFKSICYFNLFLLIICYSVLIFAEVMYDEAIILVCDYVVKIVTFCFLGLGLGSLFSFVCGMLFLYDMVAMWSTLKVLYALITCEI